MGGLASIQFIVRMLFDRYRGLLNYWQSLFACLEIGDVAQV